MVCCWRSMPGNWPAAALPASPSASTGQQPERMKRFEEPPVPTKKSRGGVLSFLGRPSPERPVLRVRMTICGQNMEEVGPFYGKWHRVADDGLLKPVHPGRDAFYA